MLRIRDYGNEPCNCRSDVELPEKLSRESSASDRRLHSRLGRTRLHQKHQRPTRSAAGSLWKIKGLLLHQHGSSEFKKRRDSSWKRALVKDFHPPAHPPIRCLLPMSLIFTVGSGCQRPASL